jgi:hypothetical protein
MNVPERMRRGRLAVHLSLQQNPLVTSISAPNWPEPEGIEHMKLNKRILAVVIAAGTTTGAMALQPAVSGASTSTHAKATIKVGSKTYKLSGGACVISSSKIQVGVHQGSNTFGINGTLSKGKFTNAEIGALLNGKSIAMTTDSGSANKKGGKFSGTDAVSGAKVSGKFTC